MRRLFAGFLALCALMLGLTATSVVTAPVAGAGTGGPYPCPNYGGGVGNGWFATNNGSVNCTIDYSNQTYYGHVVVDFYLPGADTSNCNGTNTGCSKGVIDFWSPTNTQPRAQVNGAGTFILEVIRFNPGWQNENSLWFGPCLTLTNTGAAVWNGTHWMQSFIRDGNYSHGGGGTTTGYGRHYFCNWNYARGNTNSIPMWSGEVTFWNNGIYNGGSHPAVRTYLQYYQDPDHADRQTMYGTYMIVGVGRL